MIEHNDGTPYLCDKHKDIEHQTHVSCPVCAGEDRTLLIEGHIGSANALDSLRVRVEELERENEDFRTRSCKLESLVSRLIYLGTQMRLLRRDCAKYHKISEEFTELKYDFRKTEVNLSEPT
jgi:hypothetical protein